MSEQTAAQLNPASQRRWLYGFNVGVLVFVGLLGMIILMALCEKYKDNTTWDWSTGGINSLSGSTKKLLQDIDKSKQQYTLLSLYTDPTDAQKAEGADKLQAEHRQQVRDLLRQYARNSSQ